MDHPPSPDIDALLERYLTLLDEYTTLRAELSRLQTATFHNLARANFAAERGVRFGQDYYDARMQAGRRVVVTAVRDDDTAVAEAVAAGGTVSWEVVKVGGPASTDAESEAASEGEEKGPKEEGVEEVEEKPDAKKQQVPKDPIRWFGLLTPLALRQTQASAVDAVERVVPRLVTVDAAMRQVEIEVRRARKRRAKAEAATAKQDLGQGAPRAEVTAS